MADGLSSGKVTRSVVLRFMREALTHISERTPRYSELMEATFKHLLAAGFVEGPFASYQELGNAHPLTVLLTEGYGQLTAFGYIVPRPEQPNAPNPNWFIVTETGREWALGANPIPEDLAGYSDALSTLIPGLDIVIRQYIEEALVTYGRRAFFSSAVMLGAASEKLLYLLIEAIHNSATDPVLKKTILDTIERRTLPMMFEKVTESIERAKKAAGMAYHVHEGTDQHLLSLQEGIRVQRNDAVHPQASQVTPEAVRIGLAAFPFACKKIYDLIAWFKSHNFR